MNRRLSLLIAIILIAATMFGTLATPKAASAIPVFDYCFLNGISGTYPFIFYGTPGDYKYEITTFPTGQVFTVYEKHTDVGGGWVSSDYTYSVSDCTVTFHDGRVNNRDAGQTVSIYCTPDGGIFTLIPASPVWKIGLVASAAEIAAVKPQAGKNILIKQKGHVRLFRLSDGRLQLNAPGINPTKEDYNFIFGGCGA